MSAGITLRRATFEDASLLHGWVNAPDSLSQKERTARPIQWPDHRNWLRSILAEPRSFLFIVERGGMPVGQVRLEASQGGHMVDVYVVAEARCSGVARTALSRAIEQSGISRAIARVKEDNAPSRHLFSAAGFSEVKRDNGIIVYEKDLETQHAR